MYSFIQRHVARCAQRWDGALFESSYGL